MSAARKLAFRFVASYFGVGEVILYGKYKNKKGLIKEFGQDPKGNPTILIEPIPKGRKQDKLMGLFKIWKSPEKPKEAMTDTARRLVARYLKANGIEVGRTVNIGNVRIHRYRENFQITDLTNAGKRGKKVRVVGVNLGHGSKIPSSEHETWFTELGQALVNQTSFEGVMNYLRHVKEGEPYLDVSFRDVRGIDIEPTGPKISLKTNTGLEIDSSASEGHVLHRYPLVHPTTGKANGFQDTNYYTRGRESAAVFFTWLQSNLSKVNQMDISGLLAVWSQLDIRYDSH